MPDNRLFLKQARDSVKRLIKESPERITIERLPLVDDGSGDGTLVPDPYGDPAETIMTVRLSHERRQVQTPEPVPAGLSTNLARFILVDYKTNIYSGDTFDALDRSWEIGSVDPLIKFGGIIGYQAPLREAEGAEDEDT